MINSLSAKFNPVKIQEGIVEFENSRVYPYLGLGVIVLLGVVMRFYKLGAWSFWIDEVYEVNNAKQAILSFPDLTRVSLLLIGSTLRQLGTSEWTARLIPAMVGILSLVILFFPIKRLFGPLIALLSIALLAVSPWHIYWSQNARFYTTLMLFFSLAQFAFFFWLEHDRWRYLVLTVILFGLAILERMVAAFFVPIVISYLLALVFLKYERPVGFRNRNMIVLLLPAIILGIYTLATGFFTEFSIRFLVYQFDSLRVLLAAIHDIGLPLFLFALGGGIYLIIQKSRIGLFLFTSAVIPLVILLIIAPFAQALPRYLFVAFPSWAILAAITVKEIVARMNRQAAVLGFSVLLLLFADPVSQDFLYYQFQNGNREDFKGAFEVVRAGKEEGDKLVVTRPEMAEYYLGEKGIINQAITPDDIPEMGTRVWFVIDNRSFVQPELIQWLEKNTRLVGVNDVYIPGKQMFMRVYLYEPESIRKSHEN
jgi:4-amino-4-deoxy-L-arabinose transferase-like glycosyltransferase